MSTFTACGIRRISLQKVHLPRERSVTVIADLKDGDPLMDEEQFGPALPIIRYTDVGDAVGSANGFDTGLGAAVVRPCRGPRGRRVARGSTV